MKEKNSVNEGQISIFLSLILFLVFTLVCTLIEGTRIQASRAFALNVMDMGTDSLLAEYNRELLERYDLFFIDGGYGQDGFSREFMAGRLSDYMEYNNAPSKGRSGIENADLWRLRLEGLDILKVTRATDYQGAILKEQAVSYIKSKIGLDVLEDTFSLLKLFEENKRPEKLFQEEERKNEEERKLFEEVRREMIEEDNETADKTEIKVLDEMDKLKKLSILNLVIENTVNISNKEISKETLVSSRVLPKEEVPLTEKEDLSKRLVEIMFGEYIIEKFSSYATPDSEGKLEYETEYILFGKESDYKNLKEAADKLMIIRQGANFSYLLTDGEKKQEAYHLALFLTGFTGVPSFAKTVQMALLLAWAFTESISDVKALLSGEKVPMVKTRASWRTSFESIGNRKEKGKENGEDKGLSYEDYLRIFLLLTEPGEKALRTMDMIELNVKKKDINFRIENGIESIYVKGKWRVGSLFLSLPFMEEIKYQKEGYHLVLEAVGSY